MESNVALVELLKAEGALKTARVEKAFLKVDRKPFVPPSLEREAYANYPLPILMGQTISQPLVVAITTEALDVREGMRVLEVGLGSGYQAALLAELVGKRGRIFSIDRVPELVAYARERLAGWKNVEITCGDGSLGLKEKAPFDRIVVTAACPAFPKPLVEQLKIGGRIVAPVGSRWLQDLLLGVKEKSALRTQFLLPVVFVPLIGKFGFHN